ncbi:MAG: DUF3526 domain-containing protein, partial [Paraglaciecola sp.]|nr:DUF3526 domain-containing protein [Paraglaciecola sp.]
MPSEERQANRWRMLSVLTYGGAHLIWRRLILCTTIVLALAYSVILIAVIWLEVSQGLNLALNFALNLTWLLLSITTYIIFWALVIALIFTLGKDSVFNTLSFVAIWLLLVVLIPASLQLYLGYKYQQQPALHATLQQRMVMNDGWDKPQQQMFSQFGLRYPAYQHFTLPDEAGNWEWYYAQQHMSDIAVEEQWQAYLQQNKQRFDELQSLSWLSPSLTLQLGFNQLAGTSSQAHLQYLQNVASYHQHIREYLYVHLYKALPVSQNSLSQYPRFSSKWSGSLNWHRFIPLILMLLG